MLFLGKVALCLFALSTIAAMLNGLSSLFRMVIESIGSAREERRYRPIARAKMREHYIAQAIFLRVMTGYRSPSNEQWVAASKSDSHQAHMARVSAAMNEAGKDLSVEQLKALELI